MSERGTDESVSFQQIHKMLQESYTKLASIPEAASVSQEEFETCISTLSKLWQMPTISAKD